MNGLSPDPRYSATIQRHVFSPRAATLNGLRTIVLLAGLGVPVVGLGALFGLTGATAGLAIGFVVALGSWWFSDRLALAAARAAPADPWRYPLYACTVRRLCNRAGLPMPRLFVIPGRQPNAFATGRDADHAALAVTEGLLAVLDAGELEAVIAHEIAHIGNRDTLITSVAAGIAAVVSWFARAVSLLPIVGRRDRDRGPGVATLLVDSMVTPLTAIVLRLALSPRRELRADDSGSRLLGDGVPLARALARIDSAARAEPMDIEPVQAAKFIVNPLTGHHHRRPAPFATHPSTEQRIIRLTTGAWRGVR